MIGRAKLRRWHMWLGWLVGVPMLFWTLSGFVMVVRPIEEVRGTALLREPVAVSLAAPVVAPRIVGREVKSLMLEPRAAGPRWIVGFAGEEGASRLADPATGQLLPLLGAAEATREVTSRYTGKAKVEKVTRVDPANPPIDFNRPLAAWRVRMTDGTNFYVDAGSGQVIARRTRFWRFYDFMWGLHIMDLQTRSDTHNPWIIAFSLFSLVMVVMALILLPMSSRRKKRVRNGQARPASQPFQD
ncbi:MAG TPA: PepSY domain-containing protein [Sphingomicrobium sp.]|nr:PepSY domain-containing protein [Sphingomicrobium sp.]